MKLKKMTTAVAIATIATSGAAVAGDHSNPITSALANGKISGEGYGGYTSASLDTGFGDFDASDFDLAKLRIGYSANVLENKLFAIQLEFDPNDSEDESRSDDSSVTVRDFYFASNHGDWTLTGGRFLQVFDPEAAVRQRDALFNPVFSSSGIFDDLDEDDVDSLTSFDEFSRRIDGIEAKFANNTGIHASVAVYKGGDDIDDDEIDRNFGYSGSVGINAGDSDMAFGVTLSAFQEDGDSNDFSDDEIETQGYKVSSFIATGPVIARLSYSDSEFEQTISGISLDDWEVEGIMFSGAWNISGAQRSFDEFGVLQGPEVAAGNTGYELVVSYDAYEIEQGSFDEDVDGFGIGVNAYCGAFIKYNLSYQNFEADDSDLELDLFQVGIRLSF